jgi:hypothetical protein
VRAGGGELNGKFLAYPGGRSVMRTDFELKKAIAMALTVSSPPCDDPGARFPRAI